MLYLLLCPLTSFCVSGDLQNCLYSKSEKMLGSRDLGARVIVQSFPEEPSRIQLKGVQFRDLGQVFHKHMSSLMLVGAMRGEEAQAWCLIFLLLYSRLSMIGGPGRWYVGTWRGSVVDNYTLDLWFRESLGELIKILTWRPCLRQIVIQSEPRKTEFLTFWFWNK